ncbi:MAG: hypothetical protein ACOC0E_12020 [Spirochaetota bacterium]
MRPPFRRTITALLAITLILSQIGCARRSGDGDEPAGASAAERSEGEGQPMRLTDAGRGRRPTTPGEEASPGVSASTPGDEDRRAASAERDVSIDARDEAFASRRLGAPPHYPSDFVIGSLATSGLSRPERAARQHARVFLQTVLADGRPPEDAFIEPAPGALAVIDDLASTGLAAAGVRVARPVALPGGERSIAYRVLGETGGAHGEVILEMAEGQWYISDIQAIASSRGTDDLFDPAFQSPRP